MSLHARLGVKRNQGWIGYKVHLTETCDDDEPHLIVHTETTTATTPDWGMVEPIHDALAQHDCLPSMHVVDGGYMDADAMVTSRTKHAVDLYGPVALENSWQAKPQMPSISRTSTSIGRTSGSRVPPDNTVIPGHSPRIALDKRSSTPSLLLRRVSVVRAVRSVRTGALVG